MEIDIAALDERIRKLQLLRQLLTDLDIADPSRDTLSSKSNRAKAHKTSGVRYEVLKYVAGADDVTNKRTARQIAEIMVAAKFKFKAKDPTVSARESLRELEKERLVERVGTSDDGAALWLKAA